jgi:hypothetical protein
MIVSEPQEAISAWLLERLHYVPTRNFVSFGNYSSLERRLIGAVGFDNWSEASVEMLCAGDSGWLTRELLFKAFHYPFILGGVNVVLARVGSDNDEAIRLNKHLGFVEQCRIPKAWDGGEDLILMAMTKEQCRWLSLENGRFVNAA